MADLKKQSQNDLIRNLKLLVQSERRTTAEIVEYIKEIESRKIYLEMGYPSLFVFLTEEMAYSPASAQRRIDAARLMKDIPELKQDLKTGAINLAQIAAVAQTLRAKEKNELVKIDVADKKEILDQVRHKGIGETQQMVAAYLDIEPVQFEKSLHQADKSVRVEMTLNEKQMELVKRVKELMSTTHGYPQMNEVVEFLCQEYLKRKDPLVVESRKQQRELKTEVGLMAAKCKEENAARAVTSESEVKSRIPIPVSVKRTVMARDRTCQWKDPRTQKRCESRTNLQIDHVRPVWAGGTNDFSNLQVLCGAHNRLKYRNESNTKLESG